MAGEIYPHLARFVSQKHVAKKWDRVATLRVETNLWNQHTIIIHRQFTCDSKYVPYFLVALLEI